MNPLYKNFGLVTAMSLALVTPAAYAAQPTLVNINLKSSQYMKMNWNISRIAVGSPEVATVLQLSSNEFLIVSHSAGSTTMFVWTANKKMHEYLINVSPEDVGQARIIEEGFD